MIELLCATGNRAKLREFENASAASSRSAAGEPFDCPETGDSFEANAQQKALCYAVPGRGRVALCRRLRVCRRRIGRTSPASTPRGMPESRATIEPTTISCCADCAGVPLGRADGPFHLLHRAAPRGTPGGLFSRPRRGNGCSKRRTARGASATTPCFTFRRSGASFGPPRRGRQVALQPPRERLSRDARLAALRTHDGRKPLPRLRNRRHETGKPPSPGPDLRILETVVLHREKSDRAERSFERVAAAAEGLHRRYAANGAGFRAIGFGFGGVVRRSTNSPHLCLHEDGWEEIDVAGELNARFGLPAFVENDCKLAGARRSTLRRRRRGVIGVLRNSRHGSRRRSGAGAAASRRSETSARPKSATSSSSAAARRAAAADAAASNPSAPVPA